MLMIVFVINVVLLYFLGVIIGSSVEKQRWEKVRSKSELTQRKLAMPPAVIPERHMYVEHQRMLNDRGEVVWEQKTYSRIPTPKGKKVDLLA